ncbi:glycosyltransferase [Deinococcus sp. DB0503]|uniref:glycosyltransferase n=1 Tax=Deinococcus sp. DB0503 TaxID=2479203 RepID=UPI0018DF45C2
MRILIAVAAFPPATLYGGPATVACQHAEALTRLGHQVEVLTTDAGLSADQAGRQSGEPGKGYPVTRLGATLLGGRLPALVALGLPAWLRDHLPQFDVVHVHFAREWFPLTVARAALQHGLPTVLQPHGMISGTGGLRSVVDRVATRSLLRRAGAVAVLQEVEEQAVGALEPSAHLVRVPNGICLPTLPPQGGPGEVPRQPVILFLARLHPRKRVLDFIGMAAELTRQGRELHFRVVGPDGGDRAEAERLVQALGLQERVTFTGGLAPQAVHRELVQAAVYVLPSVEEPFPMTVLEALSLGTPTVVTETLHIRSLLEQAGAVRVAAAHPHPAVSLAEEVAFLLDQPGEAARQAERGRQLVAQELTLDRVAQRLEEVYLYVCTHAPRH